MRQPVLRVLSERTVSVRFPHPKKKRRKNETSSGTAAASEAFKPDVMYKTLHVSKSSAALIAVLPFLIRVR